MTDLIDPTTKLPIKEPANVDKTGNALDTKKDGENTGLPNGDEKPAEAQSAPIASEIIVEKGFFVVKLPILNNVYQVLGQLAWAEDRIRQIYADAQIRKMEAQKNNGLVKPGGMRGFLNKWRK